MKNYVVITVLWSRYLDCEWIFEMYVVKAFHIWICIFFRNSRLKESKTFSLNNVVIFVCFSSMYLFLLYHHLNSVVVNLSQMSLYELKTWILRLFSTVLYKIPTTIMCYFLIEYIISGILHSAKWVNWLVNNSFVASSEKTFHLKKEGPKGPRSLTREKGHGS